MKKLMLLILLGVITNNKAYDITLEVQDITIVRDLILIKNTYEWCNNKKVRFDMIVRQNKLVSEEKRYLYREYLIEK